MSTYNALCEASPETFFAQLSHQTGIDLIAAYRALAPVSSEDIKNEEDESKEDNKKKPKKELSEEEIVDDLRYLAMDALTGSILVRAGRFAIPLDVVWEKEEREPNFNTIGLRLLGALRKVPGIVSEREAQEATQPVAASQPSPV